jgi:hypothetical protein
MVQMAGPVLLVLAAGVVRLVCGLAWSWLETLRDRSRRASLAALARAAGPGVTIVDRCADGGMLAIWTRDPGCGHHLSEGAR